MEFIIYFCDNALEQGSRLYRAPKAHAASVKSLDMMHIDAYTPFEQPLYT